MHIIKTNEKVLIWMNRNDITGQQIADKIGITRQAWSKKMKDNIFSAKDLSVLKELGFDN